MLDLPATDLFLLPSNESERLQVLEDLEILDTPREETFDRIARLVHLIFDVPIALVTLMDANRQWYKACIGLDADSVSRGDSFCKIPVATNTPLIVPDTTKDTRFSEHPYVVGEPGIRFYAGMPLILDGNKCVGTICAIGLKPRVFTSRDEVILADLALLVQAGLEFRRTASTDTLTEALTRRAFMLAARQLFQERRLRHFPVSIVVFDLDHFKQINDAFGHASGDAVLCSVARLCRQSLRELDSFARMGGEEFAILLPSTDEAGAHTVAEKLRQLIQSETITVPGHQVSVTASFGIFTATTAEYSLEEVLEYADQGLYQAKRNGRNRIGVRQRIPA